MPDTITLDIPAHLAAAAQATPEDLKTELAIHLYTQDRLTLEEASELAGVEIAVFERVKKEQVEQKVTRRIREQDNYYFELLNMLFFSFRGHLGNIMGVVDILLKNSTDPLTEKQEKFIKSIRHQATNILSLTEETLEQVKIKTGRIT